MSQDEIQKVEKPAIRDPLLGHAARDLNMAFPPSANDGVEDIKAGSSAVSN